MRSILAGSIVAAVLTSVTVTSITATQNEQVVPVHEEPRHRLVFDSRRTRILDVQIPPGDTTLFHTHSDPILYVTMSTSQTRSQTMGAEWSAPAADAAVPTGAPMVVPSNPPGRLMSTTSYGAKPQTHRVHNIGQSLFRLIGITNSSAGDEGTVPAPTAGFSAKPELENRWFRGYRWMLTSGASEQHHHANPVVLVAVTGRASATVAGQAKTLEQPGQFVLVEAGVEHRLQAAGGDAQVVEVEIRLPVTQNQRARLNR